MSESPDPRGVYRSEDDVVEMQLNDKENFKPQSDLGTRAWDWKSMAKGMFFDLSLNEESL